ncbi:MAG: sulfite dehydrogenase [Acidobacteria bacterium RIFCSPLOWO2_02_FULL_68_18]|nr:MAG: sulfite dehydrogenase [Acidobacteria bacterium RIFCSPLOWO2_02_FULL_68_18]OFW50364.1 MAG: sulfite dehydrogenase [Acidobacteria bacterium RIFCSPLOWO2_12_FULL_68_19]
MGSHPRSDRRRFLTSGGALAGFVMGATRPGRSQTAAPYEPQGLLAYGQPSRFANLVRRTTGRPTTITDTALMTPLQELDGIITPSGLHYLMDHVNGIPDIDPRQHRLLLHGMVDRPLTFTMEELKRFPSVSRIHFLECNANSRPLRGPNRESVQLVHGRTSCSEWTGVLLSVLLAECGVQQQASWIVAEGSDSNRYTMSIPLGKALDDALVAYAQNGEPVRPHQGYPLRLVVPGWEAIRAVKWLRRVHVVDQPYMAWHESGNNADTRPDGKGLWFRFELGPKSVITRPSGGQHLPGPGFCEITGLAWSGGGIVRRVDVSTDGGRTYREAELQQPVLPHAHTRFRFPWRWNGEEAVLQSRCTDQRGEVQPTIEEAAKILNATIDYFYQADHFNGIQPWKIARDGSVTNALP